MDEQIFVGETEDPYALAARAYVWGLSLVLATRIRQNLTRPCDPFGERLPTSPGAPLNNVGHQRRLSDPTFDAGVAPNVDTLYSVAWLDLADEPFVLEAPDFGSRYYTFQVAYGDGSTELSLGARTHGGRLPPVFVSGPSGGVAAPPGMVAVSSPTRYCMIAGRMLVRPDDPGDFAAVHELQSRIAVRPWSKHRAGDRSLPNAARKEPLLDPPGKASDPELRFLHHLGNVLQDSVPARERPIADSLRPIGLTPNDGFESQSLSPRTRGEILRGIAYGAELVERRAQNLGKNMNGWTTNYAGPRFGSDYLLRSAVAKDQIYVTVPEEALYPVAAVDSDGVRLNGENAYRITFPPDGLPPVDAFWSLTMYARNPPLVANPIDRYAIGDRTAGVVRESDGSLAIQVQNAPPAGSDVNWLPAPTGPFRLMLRLYVPRPAALDGSWVPPPVERAPAL
jgi:hypothetical protein